MPHFELFRFLFHLKPLPDSYVLDVVGGVGIQLRQGKDKVYIPYKLSGKVIDWKPKWFHVEKQWESVPAISPGPPIQWLEWNKKPVDSSQVDELSSSTGCKGESSHYRLGKHLVSSIKEQLIH